MNFFWKKIPLRQGSGDGARPTPEMRKKTDDIDLALAAAGGDADAFSVLLTRRYDGLFRLCFRLTGSKAEAEDLTQDICAMLPSKLRSFKGNAAFTTWLYRIAVNASHDRRRKQATHSRAAVGWGDWEMNRQAEIAEGQQQADWLAMAMCQLPQDLRDTLALVLDDMTHAAAADILGVSEGTISWRISQAKKQLSALRDIEDQT